MSKISTALDLIRNNRGVFAATIIERFGFLFPDVLYTKILFRLRMGYKLDLKNPRTFNEKLQWLKLYDHNPLYTTLVDKYAVKEYVAKIIGQEHIIPTLGVWDKPEEIDFDSLPNQFVLKTTHGGGNLGVYICKDKSKIDIPAVIKKMKKAMKQNLYKESREWPYKNVPKRIIAEKYISNNTGQGIDDYKFHCFNGIPEVILVCRERFQNTLKKDFFNMDWKHLDVTRMGSSVSNDVIERPENFDKMVALSKALSSKIPFVRCDFYSVGNELFFGEMTFFPSSGLNPFSPKEFDTELGDYLVLQMGGGIC